jgi:hypothetical protein
MPVFAGRRGAIAADEAFLMTDGLTKPAETSEAGHEE